VFVGPGEKVTLTIEDIAFGGEGVGRLSELVVFVPFVAIGEVVEAEITEVKKQFARARLTRVIQSSTDRENPLCPYFGDCGGCQYQHLKYSAQLQIKHKQIRDVFQRIGNFDPDLVKAVVPCPAPYGYRNRIMIRSQWDKFKQGLNIGFIRNDNRLVVDILECKIAEPAINQQITGLRQNPPPKGGIKVVLRVPPPGWKVPPDSFFQNNFWLLPKLVEVVGECLRSSGARHLVDVYCGVGFFSIELSRQVETFVGIELDQLAIKAARENSATRGCLNGEFKAGTAEELLPTLLSGFQRENTTVLLDPPRKGCGGEIMELLRKVKPSQVLYVSCHPATAARDLNILCADGVFKLTQVIPLDMFPQTQHVECVSDLRLHSSQSLPG
jgi:tRNA/tmRNA/rRNA uracil-C5-methylase (TrmA/RlmC/RlmD family)